MPRRLPRRYDRVGDLQMKLCLREDCQIYMESEKHIDKLQAENKALRETLETYKRQMAYKDGTRRNYLIEIGKVKESRDKLLVQLKYATQWLNKKDSISPNYAIQQAEAQREKEK